MTNQNDDRRNERIEDERIENMEYDPSEDVESSGDLINLDELNPDFDRPAATDSDFEADETAEPWSPPSDPVIIPRSNDRGGAEVVGDLADLGSDRDVQELIPHTDEDIAQYVERALMEDAETSDLDLRVLVRDGIVTLRGRVPSLEDSESAEEVAGRVPGVVEVRDETEITPGL